MQGHDTEYCSFRDVKALVVTWNAGASKPTDLRHDEKDANFFREVLSVHDPPDIIVFGFQELVDLEDKKLTASKTLLPTTPSATDMNQKAFSRGLRRKTRPSTSI